jgi:tetratricopeptide (TPR) repeat protein
MPQRPEQHLLEKNSRLAFETALPREWVVRRIEDDYGLDSTVEIFTDGGQTTGLFFNAQLKSTNEPTLEKAWGAIRFDRAHADYYRSLALPVLIALYHAPTRALFVRWFHAYNPHVAVKGIADTKTIRFQFYEEDRFDPDTASVIEAGLRGFLKFRSSNLPLPLGLSVARDPEAEAETVLDASDVRLALRRSLKSVAHLVQVEPHEPRPDDPAVFVGSGRSVISLGDVASVTADHPPTEELNTDVYAADLGLALSMALSYVGQANLASQIGAATAEDSSLIVNADVALTLAETMFRAQRVREAIKLADKLDESDDEDRRFAGQLMLTAELAQGRRLSDDERRTALEAAEARFKRCLARDDGTGAAAAAYSLGNLYRRFANDSQAIKWLEIAAEGDPGYLDRGYFHSDLAGPLFESGEYEKAASHYDRAIRLGKSGLYLALHADALLHTGRYEEALTRFDEYLASAPGLEGAEWRLKRAVLPLLIERSGAHQERRANQALALVEDLDLETLPASELGNARDQCEEALALDACCAEAWFRLAILLMAESEDITDAVRSCTLAAAVLHRDLPSPWVKAGVLTPPDDEERLLDICYSGFRFAGPEFAQQIGEAFQSGEAFVKDRPRLMSLLEQALAAVDEHEQQVGFTLRWIDDDGEVHEVVFTDTADESEARTAPSALAPRPASFRSKTKPQRPGKTHGKKKKPRKRKRNS